jgi:hypothetical protein
MMGLLTEARCANHAHREAAACCPECARHFCRECVTEHDGRVLCAECLRRLALGGGQRAAGVRFPGLYLGALAGLFLLWVCFYLAGQTLVLIPSSFHEGTWWEMLWRGRQ